MEDKTVEIWVKLEGVLAEPLDPPSVWAVGNILPHAEEVLTLAAAMGNVIVYGEALISPRGQRRVQRWLTANGLSHLVYWTSYEQTPPAGVEVIDSWPMKTTTEKDLRSNSNPADLPEIAPLPPLTETKTS